MLPQLASSQSLERILHTHLTWSITRRRLVHETSDLIISHGREEAFFLLALHENVIIVTIISKVDSLI